MPQFDLESAPNYQIMKNVHQAKHYNHDSCEIKEMLLVKKHDSVSLWQMACRGQCF